MLSITLPRIDLILNKPLPIFRVARKFSKILIKPLSSQNYLQIDPQILIYPLNPSSAYHFMCQKSSVCPETLPCHSNIIPAMPLRNLPEIFFLPSFLKLFLIRAQRQNLYFFFFIVCLFVCAVDHGVNEKEPVNEQYCEQVCEDQYLDQDFPEGFVNGKFNLILWCIFQPRFINTIYWPVLPKLHML